MMKSNKQVSKSRIQTTEMVSSLFFTCGHAVNKDVTVIPGGFNEYPAEDLSRVSLRFGEKWFHHDVKSDLIVSTSFDSTRQILYLLGRHGLVRRRGKAGALFNLEILRSTKFEEEKIFIGEYGLLYCVRVIAGEVYACGQSSQVYMRKNGNWEHFDKEILDLDSPTLECIDGNGSDDIYAVGQKGALVHYDGSKWRRIDIPTNRPLSSVCCVSKKEVYICGNDGVFFRGSGDIWEDLRDESKPYNYWDVEAFEGRVFLSHHVGIVKFDGHILADVDFSLDKSVSCHKLHANDGSLWSFGVDDLLVFDGSKWNEVLCPENQ